LLQILKPKKDDGQPSEAMLSEVAMQDGRRSSGEPRADLQGDDDEAEEDNRLLDFDDDASMEDDFDKSEEGDPYQEEDNFWQSVDMDQDSTMDESWLQETHGLMDCDDSSDGDSQSGENSWVDDEASGDEAIRQQKDPLIPGKRYKVETVREEDSDLDDNHSKHPPKKDSPARADIKVETVEDENDDDELNEHPPKKATPGRVDIKVETVEDENDDNGTEMNDQHASSLPSHNREGEEEIRPVIAVSRELIP
jgi:hypothetical protein